MKKLIVVLVLLFALSTVTVFAQSLDLGAFPSGRWLDSNYDAVWEFAATGIRILDLNGNVLYSFSKLTVRDLSAFLEGLNPGISFNYEDAGRSYRFAVLFSGNLRMEITRPNQALYTVELRKQ
ncbi:MAG: hypothetical protein FWC17_01660 [Treponema sp.]|nr:hypothetical protein [Treponema sp.]